ncbi:MAG: phosphatase PAP2 family protein [Candidatus Paceibacterota bacterium]|jgi:membrane-associated phospholipid phosphatase
MKYFISTLPKNIAKSFRGKNLYWHILAIIATALIVTSGFDWYYFVETRGFYLEKFFSPAIAIGAILPMFGLPILLLIGWITKNKQTRILAWVLGQAAFAGWFVSSAYKALTGRIQPPTSTLLDISRQFNFGFFKEGVFWGWPSSHTTVAFAMAFALITLYPKNKVVVVSAVLYALYIGIGISFDIHWFSEFIAGAIIGTVIGIVVGKNFDSKTFS